ncbi:hypothetical protein AUK04_03655 [Candidatus Roizmanbacteria bacterium CG2_30_33_16]|uniref:Peptidase M20 dimerisation domain-containing protein n=3 Tax=Candidatus Roizmaniibacteriota TaxID=1752723 RepID=A0A2H0C6D4_9BACT|nr:M20/M25/M40 family metallo-hydrolase [Candidatus Roizmanbacteria bacterium]OIP83199.1 MAG: hypothetical protein AUK04_03655 [Candidatus Roizmanbacteria bacterium CG2_30_33_16]PIP64878.1 MAG: hypothetical protein COW96_00120 [Candidatus Roizmanbacteria bacterium CG22_combo_CG10-13_8_21_14_all_33_16]PIX72169.1 MAG: hypothetical protein COZ39_03255 [Candidatus Roizmanbacteria bacterium CG_4_10_14_3_um_filter_33_21]
MNKIIETFIKIVSIDSPSGYEEKISLYLQSWLKKNKFSYRIDKVRNIYAYNQVNGQPILLCAHMDTVQPGENIKPIVKDGIIKSSGNTILGADNKAALTAILSAIENIKLTRSIELIFSVKEETGGGIEFFPFSWIKSKDALIFDSANPLGGIILRSPFIINFHVTVHGKAVHASKPNEGVNALTYAIKFINQIKTGSLDNGETTINIGKIDGGSGINTIPELVSYSGEIRSYDKKLFKKHLNKIKVIHHPKSKLPVIIDFSVDGFCPGYTHKKSDEFVKKIDQLYQNLHLKTQYYNYSGVSDANILNSKEIKTINLTDGVKDPHTVNESITIKSLIQLENIIKKFLLSY